VAKEQVGTTQHGKTIVAITENNGNQIMITMCAYNVGERHVIEKE